MKPWALEDLETRLTELGARGSGTDPQKTRTRHRILDAASENFVRHGYRKANIGEIARDAGIGKGTLYLYFDSKETLLVAAVAREKLSRLPHFEAVMAQPEAERLEAYITAVLRFALTAPLSGMLLRGDPELLRQLRSASDADVDAAPSLASLTQWLEATGVRPSLGNGLARMLQSVVGLAAHLVDPSARQGLDLDTFISLYARTLALGIQAVGRAPSVDSSP